MPNNMLIAHQSHQVNVGRYAPHRVRQEQQPMEGLPRVLPSVGEIVPLLETSLIISLPIHTHIFW